MHLSDFDYELPEELIAQEPLPRRDDSRLMVVARGEIRHMRFADLPELLSPEDLLVLNDTRVVPARLIGKRPGSGRQETGRHGEAGARELLLVEPVAEPSSDSRRRIFRALLKGSRRPGERLDFGSGLSGALVRREPDGSVLIELSAREGSGTLEEVLERAGHPPTPPYIKRSLQDPRERNDKERYQTVFARVAGALAAPTAGLHFTPGLLEAIRSRGVEVGSLTLHVGLGTFQPVRAERIQDHRMHAEAFHLPEALARSVTRARAAGRRVIAVGTTVARTLEAQSRSNGEVLAGTGRCDLFIYPGYRFRVVDALLTNFHLPRSTLLMLVAAFAGRREILAAYAEAVRRRYRFYSYGDAMMLV